MRRPWAHTNRTKWRSGICRGLLFCAALIASGFTFPVYNSAHIEATLASEAERIAYESPLIATLTVTSRAQDEVQLPDLNERFRGFAIVEAFEAARIVRGDKAIATWRLRLTPAGEGPWQLLPFIFTVRNANTGALDEHLSQAIVFPEPNPLPTATGAPEGNPAPEWIPPSLKTIALWVLGVAAVAGLVVALLPWLKRIKRKLKERTLSPEERARLELDRLLAEGLVAMGRVKEFYFGLTGVVRRYFERQYGIRATRQTTQEFLNHLLREVPLGAAERSALAEFLAAADRVKFAGVQVTSEEAAEATDRARTTIEVDAAQHLKTAP